MGLNVQMVSLLVSFFYGMFFFFSLELNLKFIYSSKLFIRLFVSFVFVLFHVLLYFLILMKINNGYLHFYFFLCILLGYYICKVVYKKIVKNN